MTESGPVEFSADVLQFIGAHIDSIPELEALLLLQETYPQSWDTPSLARRLYIYQEEAEAILTKLRRLKLATGDDAGFQFNNGCAQAPVIAELGVSYRKRLSAVTRLIHGKPPRSMREFARAFDLKKDKGK